MRTEGDKDSWVDNWMYEKEASLLDRRGGQSGFTDAMEQKYMAQAERAFKRTFPGWTAREPIIQPVASATEPPTVPEAATPSAYVPRHGIENSEDAFRSSERDYADAEQAATRAGNAGELTDAEHSAVWNWLDRQKMKFGKAADGEWFEPAPPPPVESADVRAALADLYDSGRDLRHYQEAEKPPVAAAGATEPPVSIAGAATRNSATGKVTPEAVHGALNGGYATPEAFQSAIDRDEAQLGFLTTDGRFVDRNEALRIAEGRQQVDLSVPEKGIGRGLDSDMLRSEQAATRARGEIPMQPPAPETAVTSNRKSHVDKSLEPSIVYW
jgi:hypothetical protein